MSSRIPLPEQAPAAKSLFSPAIDWQKNITQRLTDHAMGTYIALIKAELGTETVARLERDVMPVRIKPRRAA